jgi:L-threonylcarbamoyladenylate synthase
LTLILPKVILPKLILPELAVPTRPAIPDIVTAGLSTVGLRMPAHPVALSLIRAAGIPLAAPSANRFTELSPTTAEHVRRSLGKEVDLILDGGPCTVGIESTVLSLAGQRPVLLRPGGISRQELESAIGPVVSGQEGIGQEVLIGAHPSPGMHARHYSPRTPLFLVQDGKLPGEGRGIYLQHTHPAKPSAEPAARESLADRSAAASSPGIEVIQMPAAAADYATALYEKLHQADEANADWIAVELPPEAPEWEAVQDRLRRAASS